MLPKRHIFFILKAQNFDKIMDEQLLLWRCFISFEIQYFVLQSHMQPEHTQIRAIQLEQFITKAKSLSFKIIGTIRTIFKHKVALQNMQKYILEVYLSSNTIIRCFKRYNEFQALYSLIRMKHKNYDLGQFPSKFQILNKQETRKAYFQDMLNKIVHDHSEKDHNDRIVDSNRRLLSIVYLFLTSDIQESKGQKKFSSQKKMQTDEMTRLQGQNEQEKMMISKSQSPMKIKPKFEQKFFHEAKSQKKHKLSFEQVRESDFNFFEKPRRNSLENEFYSVVGDKKKTNINEYEFRFQEETQWKKRYLVINESGMFLYKDKLDNYFRTRIQLFRIKVQFLKRRKNIVDHFCEKMQFNVTRTFKENPEILTLYHYHDYQKVYIRKPVQRGEDPEYGNKILRELKKSIEEASQKSPVLPDFDGVFNPIGKLFIFLHKVKFNWKKDIVDQTIFLRIKTGPVLYDARPLVYSKEINVQQGFLIPITSTFETITIECLTVKDEGWIKDKQAVPKIMGKFSFNMNEIISKPQGHIYSKININLETKESKAEKYETAICASIENFSDLSSIYSESFANQNDGKIIRQIKSIDQLDSLIITVDRVLRILGNIALVVQSFWRNVYHFKYPRMGYTFFFLLALIAIFLEVNQIFKVFLFVLSCIIVYQQKTVKFVANQLMQKYFYENIHPNFKLPKLLSTSQLKYMKWSNHIKYMKEEYEIIEGRMERIPGNKINVFEFQVHGRTFTVREEEQSFFQKMKEAKKVIEVIHRMINAVVNGIEKIANLLSWVDTKRTIFFLCLLTILFGVASGWVIRIIITLFSTHRLVKGMQYYKVRHYPLNRNFGIYGVRYIINKHFPELFGHKTNRDLSLMNERELDLFLSQTVFPVHNDDYMVILKTQMEEIMGIYIEPESLIKRAIKKNYFKLGVLIDMVETCESKLKLKQISGLQERTNEFQELREKTKQIPIIDIWIQLLVFNFIFNIPSQLYLAFASKNLSKYEKKRN